MGHRLVIEATLIQAVDHVLDIVTQTCREFDPTHANALLDEQMELVGLQSLASHHFSNFAGISHGIAPLD